MSANTSFQNTWSVAEQDNGSIDDLTVFLRVTNPIQHYSTGLVFSRRKKKNSNIFLNILAIVFWLTNHSLYHMYWKVAVEDLLFLAGAVLLGGQGGGMQFQKSYMLSPVILKCVLPGLVNMELPGFSDSRIFIFILIILLIYFLNSYYSIHSSSI